MHGSCERKKIRKTYLWVVHSWMVKYFQIFPPLVFCHRLFFFTNRGSFQLRTWVWTKLRGCFHHWSLGWYFCYLKIQIILIKEKSAVWFFINCPVFVTCSWRVTWGFFFIMNNAFLDEFFVLMRLFFGLCAPQGEVKVLDFGESPSLLDFLSSFPKIDLRCGTSRLKCISTL